MLCDTDTDELLAETNMKISGSKVRRILILATVLLLMLVLCGCRTRITNNNEVSNVMYDEDGTMHDTYDYRREELGLGTARKPVFTGLGGPSDDYDDEYEYGDDAQALEEYDPDSYEDPYNDADEPEESDGQSSGRGVIRRRTSDGTTSNTSTVVEVVLDANGGTFDGLNSITVEISKTGTYEQLPEPVRDGYIFTGWYTKKSGGKNVEGKNVASSKKHKLYAHWEASGEEDAKSYTITFNTNAPEGAEAHLSGNSQITVTEGGAYQGLPSATCTGYSFLGWFTAADSGSKIEEGSKADISSDQTLYAHWDKEPLQYWTAQLGKTVGSIKDEDKASYKSGSYNSEFLQDSGLKKGGDNYDYIIFYGKEEDAEKGDKPTIVIPTEAVEGTKDTEKLLYKYKLLITLYEGTGIDIGRIAEELGVTTEELDKIKIVILPAIEAGGEIEEPEGNGEEG